MNETHEDVTPVTLTPSHHENIGSSSVGGDGKNGDDVGDGDGSDLISSSPAAASSPSPSPSPSPLPSPSEAATDSLSGGCTSSSTLSPTHRQRLSSSPSLSASSVSSPLLSSATSSSGRIRDTSIEQELGTTDATTETTMSSSLSSSSNEDISRRSSSDDTANSESHQTASSERSSSQSSSVSSSSSPLESDEEEVAIFHRAENATDEKTPDDDSKSVATGEEGDGGDVDLTSIDTETNNDRVHQGQKQEVEQQTEESLTLENEIMNQEQAAFESGETDEHGSNGSGIGKADRNDSTPEDKKEVNQTSDSGSGSEAQQEGQVLEVEQNVAADGGDTGRMCDVGDGSESVKVKGSIKKKEENNKIKKDVKVVSFSLHLNEYLSPPSSPRPSSSAAGLKIGVGSTSRRGSLLDGRRRVSSATAPTTTPPLGNFRAAGAGAMIRRRSIQEQLTHQHRQPYQPQQEEQREQRLVQVVEEITAAATPAKVPRRGSGSVNGDGCYGGVGGGGGGFVPARRFSSSPSLPSPSSSSVAAIRRRRSSAAIASSPAEETTPPLRNTTGGGADTPPPPDVAESEEAQQSVPLRPHTLPMSTPAVVRRLLNTRHELEGEVEDCRNQLGGLRKTLARRRETISNLSRTVELVTDERDTFKTQVMKLEEEIQGLSAEIHDFKKNTNGEQTQMQRQSQRKESLSHSSSREGVVGGGGNKLCGRKGKLKKKKQGGGLEEGMESNGGGNEVHDADAVDATQQSTGAVVTGGEEPNDQEKSQQKQQQLGKETDHGDELSTATALLEADLTDALEQLVAAEEEATRWQNEFENYKRQVESGEIGSVNKKKSGEEMEQQGEKGDSKQKQVQALDGLTHDGLTNDPTGMAAAVTLLEADLTEALERLVVAEEEAAQYKKQLAEAVVDATTATTIEKSSNNKDTNLLKEQLRVELEREWAEERAALQHSIEEIKALVEFADDQKSNRQAMKDATCGTDSLEIEKQYQSSVDQHQNQLLDAAEERFSTSDKLTQQLRKELMEMDERYARETIVSAQLEALMDLQQEEAWWIRDRSEVLLKEFKQQQRLIEELKREMKHTSQLSTATTTTVTTREQENLTAVAAAEAEPPAVMARVAVASPTDDENIVVHKNGDVDKNVDEGHDDTSAATLRTTTVLPYPLRLLHEALGHGPQRQDDEHRTSSSSDDNTVTSHDAHSTFKSMTAYGTTMTDRLPSYLNLLHEALLPNGGNKEATSPSSPSLPSPSSPSPSPSQPPPNSTTDGPSNDEMMGAHQLVIKLCDALTKERDMLRAEVEEGKVAISERNVRAAALQKAHDQSAAEVVALREELQQQKARAAVSAAAVAQQAAEYQQTCTALRGERDRLDEENQSFLREKTRQGELTDRMQQECDALRCERDAMMTRKNSASLAEEAAALVEEEVSQIKQEERIQKNTPAVAEKEKEEDAEKVVTAAEAVVDAPPEKLITERKEQEHGHVVGHHDGAGATAGPAAAPAVPYSVFSLSDVARSCYQHYVTYYLERFSTVFRLEESAICRLHYFLLRLPPHLKHHSQLKGSENGNDKESGGNYDHHHQPSSLSSSQTQTQRNDDDDGDADADATKKEQQMVVESSSSSSSIPSSSSFSSFTSLPPPSLLADYVKQQQQQYQHARNQQNKQTRVWTEENTTSHTHHLHQCDGKNNGGHDTTSTSSSSSSSLSSRFTEQIEVYIQSVWTLLHDHRQTRRTDHPVTEEDAHHKASSSSSSPSSTPQAVDALLHECHRVYHQYCRVSESIAVQILEPNTDTTAVGGDGTGHSVGGDGTGVTAAADIDTAAAVTDTTSTRGGEDDNRDAVLQSSSSLLHHKVRSLKGIQRCYCRLMNVVGSLQLFGFGHHSAYASSSSFSSSSSASALTDTDVPAVSVTASSPVSPSIQMPQNLLKHKICGSGGHHRDRITHSPSCEDRLLAMGRADPVLIQLANKLALFDALGSGSEVDGTCHAEEQEQEHNEKECKEVQASSLPPVSPSIKASSVSNNKRKKTLSSVTAATTDPLAVMSSLLCPFLSSSAKVSSNSISIPGGSEVQSDHRPPAAAVANQHEDDAERDRKTRTDADHDGEKEKEKQQQQERRHHYQQQQQPNRSRSPSLRRTITFDVDTFDVVDATIDIEDSDGDYADIEKSAIVFFNKASAVGAIPKQQPKEETHKETTTTIQKERVEAEEEEKKATTAVVGKGTATAGSTEATRFSRSSQTECVANQPTNQQQQRGEDHHHNDDELDQQKQQQQQQQQQQLRRIDMLAVELTTAQEAVRYATEEVAELRVEVTRLRERESVLTEQLRQQLAESEEASSVKAKEELRKAEKKLLINADTSQEEELKEAKSAAEQLNSEQKEIVRERVANATSKIQVEQEEGGKEEKGMTYRYDEHQHHLVHHHHRGGSINNNSVGDGGGGGGGSGSCTSSAGEGGGSGSGGAALEAAEVLLSVERQYNKQLKLENTLLMKKLDEVFMWGAQHNMNCVVSSASASPNQISQDGDDSSATGFMLHLQHPPLDNSNDNSNSHNSNTSPPMDTDSSSRPHQDQGREDQQKGHKYKQESRYAPSSSVGSTTYSTSPSDNYLAADNDSKASNSSSVVSASVSAGFSQGSAAGSHPNPVISCTTDSSSTSTSRGAAAAATHHVIKQPPHHFMMSDTVHVHSHLGLQERLETLSKAIYSEQGSLIHENAELKARCVELETVMYRMKTHQTTSSPVPSASLVLVDGNDRCSADKTFTNIFFDLRQNFDDQLLVFMECLGRDAKQRAAMEQQRTKLSYDQCLAEEHTELRNLNAKFKEEISALWQERDALTSALSHLRSQHSLVQEHAELLQQEVDELIAQKSTAGDSDGVGGRVGSKNENRSLRLMEGSADTPDDDTSQEDEDRRDESDSTRALTFACDALTRERDTLRAEVEEGKIVISERNVKAAALQKAHDQSTAEVVALREELQQQKARAAVSAAAVAQQAAEYQQTCTALRGERDRLDEENQSFLREKTRQEESLDRMKSECDAVLREKTALAEQSHHNEAQLRSEMLIERQKQSDERDAYLREIEQTRREAEEAIAVATGRWTTQSADLVSLFSDLDRGMAVLRQLYTVMWQSISVTEATSSVSSAAVAKKYESYHHHLYNVTCDGSGADGTEDCRRERNDGSGERLNMPAKAAAVKNLSTANAAVERDTRAASASFSYSPPKQHQVIQQHHGEFMEQLAGCHKLVRQAYVTSFPS